METLNEILLIGRITERPELKVTRNGLGFSEFGLAVNEPKGADGSEYTNFFNIVAWRAKAEFCAKYLDKGQCIFVSGHVRVERYKDKDGKNRTSWTVVADNIQALGWAKNSQKGPQDAQQTPDGVNGRAQQTNANVARGTDGHRFAEADTRIDDEMPF